MCTAVDGGSIHRAARRLSAASDQRSTTPMASHRTKDRRKPLRRGVLGFVSGFSVTFQNNNWAGLLRVEIGNYVRGNLQSSMLQIRSKVLPISIQSPEV